MPITIDDVIYLSEGETRTPLVAFDKVLRTGELLTGTPTVEEQTTSDMTIDNVARNAAQVTIKDRAVAIDQAIQFRVSGQLAANSPYTLKITASTDGGSGPAQTIVANVPVIVE